MFDRWEGLPKLALDTIKNGQVSGLPIKNQWSDLPKTPTGLISFDQINLAVCARPLSQESSPFDSR